MKIEVVLGFITKLKVDAIVNAANQDLISGGGMCEAVFVAAGDGLQQECHKIGYCETGSAATTNANLLPIKFIIHAVGPIYEQAPEIDPAFSLPATERQ